MPSTGCRLNSRNCLSSSKVEPSIGEVDLKTKQSLFDGIVICENQVVSIREHALFALDVPRIGVLTFVDASRKDTAARLYYLT